MTTFALTGGQPAAPVAWPNGAADAALTYGELHAAVAGVARQLGSGRDVLLLCEDRYWFAVALLGAWQAGRRVTLPPHRGHAVLEELKSRHVVLHDGGLSPNQPQPAQGHLDSGGAPSLIDVRGARPVHDAVLPVIDGERELLTLYTSGSSGQPVSWVKRARQLLGEARVLADQLGIESSDRMLPTVAPQHIYGLLFGVLVPLAAGASFARWTPLHGEEIRGGVQCMAASWLVSVPAHLQVLSRLLDASSGGSTEGRTFGSLRAVVSSGAPLEVAVGRRFLRAGLDVLDVLGSTETGGIALRRTGEESLWTPLPGVQVSTDEQERLLVRSPFLANVDVPYVAGDRAAIAEGGRFRHLGRADGVVKVGGKRISLAEVEEEARALPGVRDAAALRQRVGGLRGEEIWLVAEGEGLSTQALRAALRQRIDPVFVPRRIRVVDGLPREENGKLQRERLLDLFEAQQELTWFDRAHDGERVSASVRVPDDWHRFAGHFPGDPLLPALAQLQDLVLPLVRSAWPDLGPLRQCRRLKFLRPVRGGARLTVTVVRSILEESIARGVVDGSEEREAPGAAGSFDERRFRCKVAFELHDSEQPFARGTLWFEDP